MAQEIISFYMENIENDDVSALTCDTYGIPEETLEYLLLDNLLSEGI